jgi:hypothetical protein
MKNHSLLLSFILLTFCSSVIAQESQPKPVKRISIRELQLQTGFIAGHQNNNTLSDFKALAPQSLLLNRNFSGYNQYNSFYNVNWSNSLFTFSLGIQFSDKQKTAYKSNPLLRIGVSYLNRTSLTSSLNREERFPYDTLVSARTGQTIYVDSTTSNSYTMNYTSEQIRLDLSLIYRTNPSRRWSLFAGIGITVGSSINATTEISHSQYNRFDSYTTNRNNYSSYGGSSSGLNENETIRNKNEFGFTAYLPLGIDVRLGRKYEFWKRLHLFNEMRPGIYMLSIPGIPMIKYAFMQNQIGIRVTLD